MLEISSKDSNEDLGYGRYPANSIHQYERVMNRIAPAAVLLLFVLLAGCGESFTQLSGKVTLDDKPLPGGTLVFVSEDGSKTEHVPIKPDGTYSSERIPYGNLRIGVTPPPPSAASFMPKGVEIRKDNPNAASLQAGGPPVKVPDKLQDPTKSGVTFKADGGQKTFDVVLKST